MPRSPLLASVYAAIVGSTAEILDPDDRADSVCTDDTGNDLPFFGPEPEPNAHRQDIIEGLPTQMMTDP